MSFTTVRAFVFDIFLNGLKKSIVITLSEGQISEIAVHHTLKSHRIFANIPSQCQVMPVERYNQILREPATLCVDVPQNAMSYQAIVQANTLVCDFQNIPWLLSFIVHNESPVTGVPIDDCAICEIPDVGFLVKSTIQNIDRMLNFINTFMDLPTEAVDNISFYTNHSGVAVLITSDKKISTEGKDLSPWGYAKAIYKEGTLYIAAQPGLYAGSVPNIYPSIYPSEYYGSHLLPKRPTSPQRSNSVNSRANKTHEW